MSIELAEQTLGKGKVRVHVHVCLQRMELQLKVKNARQLALCGAVPFAVRRGPESVSYTHLRAHETRRHL
eukprot:10600725-Prorocentrum_lima.AAC.1